MPTVMICSIPPTPNVKIEGYPKHAGRKNSKIIPKIHVKNIFWFNKNLKIVTLF